MLRPAWRALLRSDWRMAINLLGMDNAGQVNRIRGIFSALLAIALSLGSGWLVTHHLLQLLVSYFSSEAVDIFLAAIGTIYLLSCFSNPSSTQQSLFPPYTVTLFTTQPIPAMDVVIWRIFSFLSIIGIIQAALIFPIVFEVCSFHRLSLGGFIYLGINAFFYIIICFLVKLLLASTYHGRYRLLLRLFSITIMIGLVLRVYFLIFAPNGFIWQPGEFLVIAVHSWRLGGWEGILLGTVAVAGILVGLIYLNMRENRKPSASLEELVNAGRGDPGMQIGRLNWPRRSSRWRIISRLEAICVLRNRRVLGGVFIFPALVSLLMGAACRSEPTWANFSAAVLAACWAVFFTVVKQLVAVNRDFEVLLRGYPLHNRDVIIGRASAAVLLGLPIFLLWIGAIAVISSYPLSANMILPVISIILFAVPITIALTLSLSYRFFRWFAGNTFSDIMIGQLAGICALLVTTLPGLILGRLIFESSGLLAMVGTLGSLVLGATITMLLLKVCVISARRYPG